MQQPTATLSNILVPFAEAASINPRDAANTLKKRIIVSLGFIDTRALHERLFAGAHMDWDTVIPYVQKVSLTVEEWCELVTLLHFIREPELPKHVAEMVAASMAGLKVTKHQQKLTPAESMRLSFARAGMAPTWDILAKSLLLCNLADVDHASALRFFLSDRDNSSNIMALISNIGSHRHTQDEYTSAFAALLSDDGCHVASHHVINSLKLREEELERMRKTSRAMTRAAQKPSLTAIVSALSTSANKKTSSSSNFAAFCSGARMQGNTSLRVRRSCYYFKTHPVSACALLWRILGEDQIVMDAMESMPQITSPDVTVLRLFLEDAHMDGEPPHCLRVFKDTVGIVGHNWSTVLRMYLAVYTNHSLLRELWEHVVTLGVGSITIQHYCTIAGDDSAHNNIITIAPETEKVIKSFVSEHACAYNELHAEMFIGC